MIKFKTRWYFKDAQRSWDKRITPREFLTIIETTIDNINHNHYPAKRVELPFFTWFSPEETAEYVVAASVNRIVKIQHFSVPWKGQDGPGVEIGMHISGPEKDETYLRKFIIDLASYLPHIDVEIE